MSSFRRRNPRVRAAFTLVEMLVVMAIIGILVGMLLPAVTNARNQALVAQSQANLRQLATAHASYASEWGDRQFTLTKDNISSYGIEPYPGPPGAVASVAQYHDVHGKWPPAVELGWGGYPGFASSYKLWSLAIGPESPKKNYVLLEPIVFTGAFGDPDSDIDRMGYFRLPNARQFSQYLDGRFFNPIFYAPKDTIVHDMVKVAFDFADEYPDPSFLDATYGWREDQHFCYSSYSMSPAALFSPDVLRNSAEGGWQDPWTLPAGFRAPARSQVAYPSLKTQMIEHHWLQGRRSECNERVPDGSYQPYVLGGDLSCQPYFFNQARESTPATLFFDAHIELVSVTDAERFDGRVKVQSAGDTGLWSRDTPFGDDGYFIGRSWDDANTSFHILTTDGVRGRDVLTD
jgi:prepilin-type N-terminal cleavage/methylation domain-containing protein